MIRGLLHGLAMALMLWILLAAIALHSCNAQLMPGDTLRYTTNGTDPDSTSPFVTASSPKLWISQTTIIRARLYRPGFAPTPVKIDTVHVASGFHELRVGVWSRDSVAISRLQDSTVAVLRMLRQQGKDIDLLIDLHKWWR